MSEKPFWEGKTCKEMAGLHVKATWKNGTIVTGVLDDTGDIDLGDNRSLYTSRGYDSSCDFEPIDNIQSIELLDDPEYERIEEADDLQEKDIAVMLDGNRYKVTDVEKGRNRFWGRVYGAVEPECIALGFNAFTYGLRPKPRLPDKPGLWLDKDDNTWVMGENAFPLTCIDAGNWSITRPQFSTDSVQVLNAAPFRLAKAVEA